MTTSAQFADTPESAILFVGGDGGHTTALGLPTVLLPLHGKSMLQRSIEQLVLRGCCQIHVVVDDDATEVRAFLRSGERWGCTLSYHYRTALSSLAGFVRALDATQIGHYWLAVATHLPTDPLPACDPTAAAGHLFCWDEDGTRRWTGWGRFSRAWLLSQDVWHDWAYFERQVLGDVRLLSVVAGRPLSAATPAELLASSRRLLEAGSADRPTVGRGSKIHPSARLVPPVWIGPEVKIGAGAVIGPYAAVESGALIDKRVNVRDSVVMPDTYVGEELDLDRAVVRGGVLVNTALDAVAQCQDPNLLGELAVTPSPRGLAQRLIAGMLRLGLLPLYALARWRTRDASIPALSLVTVACPRRNQVEPGQMPLRLDLPDASADATPQPWARHFCRTFYPGLQEVMRGNLALVGPSLRSFHEVRRLPQDWRFLYGRSRCGLLNDATLQDGGASTAEVQYASDAMGAANQAMLGKTRHLLYGYLGRVLREVLGGPCPWPGSLDGTRHKDAI